MTSGGLQPLSADEWDALQDAFVEALERDGPDRDEFLAGAFAGSPGLRAELAALLAAHDRAGGFLDPSDVVDLLPETGGTSLIGSSIGPWHLVEELGRGGMGTVYLADRADGQFEQRVAIKVVKRGMDTDAILRRFVRERQILARLEHPNIGRLLDGGVTKDDRPFLAMEYVPGDTLLEYCEDRSLSVDRRLELFLDVCGAVEYAHGRLVVHRDLKPSNILVTETGHVKLLDFGIAKVLQGDDDESTTLTLAGSNPLTPEYAAPEQLEGSPVTTAADVYALGAILYRLLTGHGPFRFASREPAEVLRVTSRTEPVPPSQAIGGDGTVKGESAETGHQPEHHDRAREQRRLRRKLKGDLDTIVLTALRREPERRYRSAQALREDLERYLNGHPIFARPDTPSYRVSKFVARNRVGVAAAAVLALTLFGGVAGIVLERAETARERDRAQAEADKATQFAAFLADIFRSADPNTSGGEDISARQLLEAGATRIDIDLAGQPEVAAEMASLIAGVLQNLGDLDASVEVFTKSVPLHAEAFGDQSPEMAVLLGDLAEVQYARGDLAAADTLLAAALEIAEALPLGSGADLPHILEGIAVLKEAEGDLETAGAIHHRVLELRRARGDSANVPIAASLTNLGINAQRRGDAEEAVGYHREALAIRLSILGEEHQLVASARRELAGALYASGQLAEARELFRMVLEYELRVHGEVHPSTGVTLNNLGFVLTVTGSFQESVDLLTRALSVRRELYGNADARVATTLRNLGSALVGMGDAAAALPYLEESLSTLRALPRSNPSHVAQTLLQLSGAALAMGDLEGARSWLEEASDIIGEEERYLGTLAAIRFAGGDLAAADSLYAEVEALQRGSPEDHTRLAATLVARGEIAALTGREGAAEPMLRRALAILEPRLPAGHWRLAEARSVLGDCLSRQGRTGEAEALLRSAVVDLETNLADAAPVLERARRRVRAHEAREVGA